MKTFAFALRNFKEILRDKLTLFFGIGFPVILLLMLSVIQKNIPVSLFEPEHLTPGVAFFGLSFISLFSALTIAKDKSTAFMTRLRVSPMSAYDFLFGYTLPLIPMAIAQMLICFALAIPLGLKFTPRIFLSIAALLLSALMYIALGLIFGCLLNDKQVGGICGALLTNLSAWLSGVWFDITLLGGAFGKIANCLPFIHGVEAARAALNGGDVFPHLWWLIGYDIVLIALSVILFNRMLKSDK